MEKSSAPFTELRGQAAAQRADGPAWPKKRRVEYFWMIMGICNYRCPYCVYGLVPFDRRTVKAYYGPDEWLAAWTRMHDRYGEGNIILTGGEPTMYPKFTELVPRLNEMFWIAFDTNLSIEKPRLEEFLKRVKPDRLRVETSFHPHTADTREFIDKVRVIRDAGFGYINRLVCYPDLIAKIPSYRDAFAEHGLTFVANPFQGWYEGRKYPEAYTDEERRVISGATVNVVDKPENKTHAEFVKQILNVESPKGRLCRSGYQHVRVEDDGAVYRCGEYSTLKLEKMGEFFDENLTLWDEPKICRSERCEWEYRWLVDQAERFQNGHLE